MNIFIIHKKENAMSYPYRPTQKWDVHTHTTLSPATYGALERFADYDRFVRVRGRSAGQCGAEIIDSQGRVFRTIMKNAYDPEARLLDMNADRVTVQVISPTPAMIPDYIDDEADASQICRILNDDSLSLVAKYPERFTALGALPMRFPDQAIHEMERIQSCGMRGFEINSNVDGMDLDDPRLFAIFQAAAEKGMAVFVHPWAGFMSPRIETALQRRMHEKRNWRPWLLGMPLETALAFDAMRSGGVHERLPNLRVLYAHGGGAFPALLGRLEHGQYCRPDLFKEASSISPWETILNSGVYVDTLTHNPWVLKMLIDVMGSSRMAMGSDYPYPLGEQEPFGPESRRDILGNECPYSGPKSIYPGHMIEHLPSSFAEAAEARNYFGWLPDRNADGPRPLPMLTPHEKGHMLFGTARRWLGYDGPL